MLVSSASAGAWLLPPSALLREQIRARQQSGRWTEHPWHSQADGDAEAPGNVLQELMK